jgi:hypothetical protein
MAQPVVNDCELKIVKLTQRSCHKCGVTTDEDYIYECEECNLIHCEDCAIRTQVQFWPDNIFGSDDCSICRGVQRCIEHECLYCKHCFECDGFHYSGPAISGNRPPYVYDNWCDCGDDFMCDCFDGPEEVISFQLGYKKNTPSNLSQFIIRFVNYPSYYKSIFMGGACRFELEEKYFVSIRNVGLRALLDSGVDYWKRKFHGFHSKEMKDIVLVLLLIYRRSCTNTLQLSYIPEEIWMLFPRFLRSADVSIHPSIKF